MPRHEQAPPNTSGMAELLMACDAQALRQALADRLASGPKLTWEQFELINPILLTAAVRTIGDRGPG